MIRYLKVYLVTFIVFLVLDMIWLMLISPKLYNKYIGHLLAPEVNAAPAIVFYLLFIGGLVYFVILPSIAKNSGKSAFISGSFFGLVCYATFDLTSMATLKDWPLAITLIDLIWGTFICSTSSTVSFFINKRFS